jgi:hypothetical protein
MNFKRLYYKLTCKVPTQELNWNVEDFRIGMRWAKSLPHPFLRSKSLWETFNRWDSVDILHFLNKKIRENQSVEVS